MVAFFGPMAQNAFKLSLSNDSDTENIEVKFRGMLKEFCEFATKFGYHIEPYRAATWVKFRTLPITSQKDTFEKFCTYYNLCMMAGQSGISFSDDASLAWWALKEFGFRPCSDFFNKLEKDDAIEIYNQEGTQIYRNWSFFRFSGYSMGDLFIYHWNELYSRDQEVVDSLFSHAAKVLSPESRSTFECSTKRHVMVETISPTQNICDVHFKYISPLFDKSDNTVAFVITSSTKKIGQKVDQPLAPESEMDLI